MITSPRRVAPQHLFRRMFLVISLLLGMPCGAVAQFVKITSGPLGDDASSYGVAWGDFDNDGDLDLYVANNGRSNKLIRNELTSGSHWLQVTLESNAVKKGGAERPNKLAGAVASLTGIGARVKLMAGGVTQIREIAGGSGNASQDAMVASFGLGSATAVVDGVLTVTAPTWVADVPDRAVPTKTVLLGAVPNPFNPSTMLSLDLAEPGHVRLRIDDVAGRRVANLLDEQRAAGRYHVVREGRDRAGRWDPAGVYPYRMDVGAYTETKRMLLVKWSLSQLA